MSARIFPFVGSPLPDIVYLDTSFVWEIHNPHADPIRQAQCAAFGARLNQAEVMMVINSWVIQELRHVILVGVYRQTETIVAVADADETAGSIGSQIYLVRKRNSKRVATVVNINAIFLRFAHTLWMLETHRAVQKKCPCVFKINAKILDKTEISHAVSEIKHLCRRVTPIGSGACFSCISVKENKVGRLIRIVQ